MTAIDAPAIARRPSFGGLRRLAARLVPASAGDAAAARERRAFVQDMSIRNPDAFSSDLDMQAMLLHFPGRF
jgi:hypothetical protein